MTTEQRDLSPPPAKKVKESPEEAKHTTQQQLVERNWVKVEESKQKPDQQLLKVMQWNTLADGEHTLLNT